ncbi:MAG: LysR family transcriptional regulator [Bulleidia sp.]
MISNHLKYPAQIRKCRNITKEALKQNISQPYLFRFLKDKKKELGHELFVRDSKGQITGTTAFGDMFFSCLDRILAIDEEYQRKKQF